MCLVASKLASRGGICRRAVSGAFLLCSSSFPYVDGVGVSPTISMFQFLTAREVIIPLVFSKQFACCLFPYDGRTCNLPAEFHVVTWLGHATLLHVIYFLPTGSPRARASDPASKDGGAAMAATASGATGEFLPACCLPCFGRGMNMLRIRPQNIAISTPSARVYFGLPPSACPPLAKNGRALDEL